MDRGRSGGGGVVCGESSQKPVRDLLNDVAGGGGGVVSGEPSENPVRDFVKHVPVFGVLNGTIE